MIKLSNLVFGYRKQPLLFDGVNLTLQTGRIYGLLGKNGVGKTTLLKNMLGLVYPKSGKCMVNGFDAAKRLPVFLRQVYFLPEEPYIPDSSGSAFVNATSPFYPHYDHEAFIQYLAVFEVPIQQVLTKLSLGQQKKFMIAFALACNTAVLLMDEPTNGLDIPSKAIFRKVMASAFNENRCIVISTHQVRDLDNLIDTIVVLHEQQIMLHANLDELATKVLFGKIAPPDVVNALYYEEAFSGIRAMMANPENIQSKPDLELLFNAVTNHHTSFLDYLNTMN